MSSTREIHRQKNKDMLTVYSIAVASFVLTPAAVPHRTLATPPAVFMLDIPRVELPDAVASTIKEQGLKSPNELGTTDYNTYSAAAIGGTLIFFLLPLFNIFGFLGDFVFSALIGGGAAAYCSLRKDEVGGYANQFGGYVMKALDKVEESKVLDQAQAKVTELVDKAKKSL